jgi:hypothetical protein
VKHLWSAFWIDIYCKVIAVVLTAFAVYSLAAENKTDEAPALSPSEFGALGPDHTVALASAGVVRNFGRRVPDWTTATNQALLRT